MNYQNFDHFSHLLFDSKAWSKPRVFRICQGKQFIKVSWHKIWPKSSSMKASMKIEAFKIYLLPSFISSLFSFINWIVNIVAYMSFKIAKKFHCLHCQRVLTGVQQKSLNKVDSARNVNDSRLRLQFNEVESVKHWIQDLTDDRHQQAPSAVYLAKKRRLFFPPAWSGVYFWV